MSEKITTCISVWLDETGNEPEAKWIVSKDDIFESRLTAHTQTINVFDFYNDAVSFAKNKAHELNLSVYETTNTYKARSNLLYGNYTAEICNGDFGSVTFFAENFSDAKEKAIEWAKVGEWKTNDEVTVSLSGPDDTDAFEVQVFASKAQ